VVGAFGTVDALALLAGRIPLTPLADVSEDEWDGVISSHLKGHFTLIQAAAPVMKEKRYGRIVGFASVQGTIGDSHQTPYCAAKAGIIGLMRAITIELDAFGICANAVCPAGVDGQFGPIATRLVGPSVKVASLVSPVSRRAGSTATSSTSPAPGGSVCIGRWCRSDPSSNRAASPWMRSATRWSGCSSRCIPANPVNGRDCCRPQASNSTDCPRASHRCCTKCFPPQGFSRRRRHRRALRGADLLAQVALDAG
jgi:NAD(P)-dependent dehydrogenase (short-subunit alcohol dehydrogenase family)